MTEARYGRMNIGKCIKSGTTGCSTDILEIMDSFCSNKRTCDLNVADFSFNERIADPCNHMISYFEASYICKKGLLIKINEMCFWILFQLLADMLYLLNV